MENNKKEDSENNENVCRKEITNRDLDEKTVGIDIEKKNEIIIRLRKYRLSE